MAPLEGVAHPDLSCVPEGKQERSAVSFHQRQRREETSQSRSITRCDADRHRLPGVGRIALDDEVVGDADGGQAVSDATKVLLVPRVERDGERAGGQGARTRLAGSVNELRGLHPAR